MNLYLKDYPQNNNSFYNRRTDFETNRSMKQKSPSNLSLISARMLRDHVQKSSRGYVEMHSKKLLESMMSPTTSYRAMPSLPSQITNSDLHV